MRLVGPSMKRVGWTPGVTIISNASGLFPFQGHFDRYGDQSGYHQQCQRDHPACCFSAHPFWILATSCINACFSCPRHPRNYPGTKDASDGGVLDIGYNPQGNAKAAHALRQIKWCFGFDYGWKEDLRRYNAGSKWSTELLVW
jgi:hypothetical protein